MSPQRRPQPPPRPPAAYVHGIDGPVAIISGRIAARIAPLLHDFRTQQRGADPDLDAQLIALATAAAAWRAEHFGTSGDGSTPAETAETVPSSAPMDTHTAAIRLGVTERAVRHACASGRIDAELVAGRWHITAEALAHYRAARAARATA